MSNSSLSWAWPSLAAACLTIILKKQSLLCENTAPNTYKPKNLIKIIIVTRWYWTSSIPVLSTSEGHKVGQAVPPWLLGEKGLFIQLDHHTTFPVHDKGPLLSLHVIQYRNDNMVWQINTHCPICPPPPPPLCLPLPVWPPTTPTIPGFKGGSSSSGMEWEVSRG